MLLSQNLENQNTNSIYLKSNATKLYRKNSIIYKQGDKIEFVYIILNGEVESIFKKNKKLKENIILKKGSPLGLMDLILNRDYSKTMLTKKTSVLALIKKNYFLHFLKPFSCEAILLKSLAIDIDNQKKNLWS
ncbi:MAG: hypothetical protein CMJ06_00075 [Pelagibacterales bacterium]|nr:hypothetical protein [Pelagibacterales bacterium]|tara:strand:+ start:111 stop:509 length:399 start_codon:yes stop_codon:yes gene_type:complete